MKRIKIDRITPIFVEFIPDDVEPGKLYISETYQQRFTNVAVDVEKK